jgi:hypothetical protein
MKPLNTSDLTERVRFEQLSGAAWVAVAVLAASVLPGGTASRSPELIPELPSAATAQPYIVRVRYRTDLESGMRIRWGRKTLSLDSVVDPDNHRHELAIQATSVPSFTDRHAQALAAITLEGFAVTFSKESTAGYDSPTDTPASPAATSAIAGYAKWLGNETPQQYEAGTVIETEAAKLLFIPSTYGQLPAQGAIATIGANGFVVKSVTPIAPDATAIGAYITVER